MPTLFITGVSKGIGLALAKRFHAGGYTVSGCARHVAALPPFITAYACDIADKAAVQDLAARFLKAAGPPDVLINNAGVFRPGQVHNEADGVLEELFAVNVAGVYHLTRALLPGMMTRRSGDIVNICSTASIMPYVNGGSYCITKFALLGMTRVLREEMKPHGVRVLAVLPGPTLTDSWKGSDLPPERFIPPDAVAEAVFAAVSLPRGTVVEELLLRPQDGDI